MKLQKMMHNHLPQHLNFAMKFGPERCVNTVTGPNQSDRARIKMTDAPNSGKVSAIQEIISRADAKARGLLTFCTGRPCARGHNGPRYVSDTSCFVCRADDRAKNKEKIKEYNRQYRIKNPDVDSRKDKNKVNARARARYAANPEKKKNAIYAWRAQNPDKAKDFCRQYQAKNVEHVRAQKAEYYRKNRAAILERDRIYREKNRDARNEASRIWRRENPEKRRATDRNKKAIRRGAVGKYVAKDILRIAEAQKQKCAYCKVSIKDIFHIDHIQPLSRGGTNWPSNLQLLCPPCNMAKSAKDPIDFAKSKGLLV